MTSANPTPAPNPSDPAAPTAATGASDAPDTAASVEASGSAASDSGAAETTAGSPSAVSAAPTTPPPGPLTPDALAALQAALAAEQAAVWAYGLVAAYARDQASMVADARSGHLLRRDATTARLIQGGATAPEPAAAYQVSVAVSDAATALQLAQDIETDAAAAWRVVIGSTDDAELRGFALTGLSDAAVRLALWKQVVGVNPVTVPFPGQV
jgi:Domain of unknown function (DUF4439)